MDDELPEDELPEDDALDVALDVALDEVEPLSLLVLLLVSDEVLLELVEVSLLLPRASVR